jgi:hypothetical protein
MVVINAADNALRAFNIVGCPDCIDTSPLRDFFLFPNNLCAICALASWGFATFLTPSDFKVSADILSLFPLALVSPSSSLCCSTCWVTAFDAVAFATAALAVAGVAFDADDEPEAELLSPTSGKANAAIATASTAMKIALLIFIVLFPLQVVWNPDSKSSNDHRRRRAYRQEALHSRS